jgi:hypothetical protein
MGTQPIDYEAVIADLEAKKAHLQSTIDMLRALSGLGTLGITPPTGAPGGGGGGRIAPDAFFGKSIPEAAVIHLTNVRQKLSTQQLMDAMEAGGLPKSKYNTVYAILRRRENQVGDIVNMQGEWGLAAWYPNHTKPKPTKKGPATEADSGEDVTPAADLEEMLAGDSSAIA